MMALLCVLTLASCADLLSTTKFERGTRTDEAYTNTSAGLAFVKPSGWVFYTDDQLEQTFKVSKDLLKDPDAMDKADVSSLYEFMAVDSSTGNNVNLVVAKGNGVTSVEKYVEQVKKELSDQLTSGVTVTFGDGTSNVKLGDGTWVTYSAQVSTNGVNMTQYYFARKVGKIAVAILVRVILACQIPVGGFYFLIGGALRDAEHLIWVFHVFVYLLLLRLFAETGSGNRMRFAVRGIPSSTMLRITPLTFRSGISRRSNASEIPSASRHSARRMPCGTCCTSSMKTTKSGRRALTSSTKNIMT